MTNDQAGQPLNEVQAALVVLIKKYVRRQSLVQHALCDLRPDNVARYRGKDNFTIEERLELARRPQTGLWGKNNEWHHRVHGNGCHLTHTITKEPIGWDLGSLCTFDRYWFVNHLEWMLTQTTTTDAIITIKEWIAQTPMVANARQSPYFSDSVTINAIFSLLEELVGLGILSEVENTMRYTLL